MPYSTSLPLEENLTILLNRQARRPYSSGETTPILLTKAVWNLQDQIDGGSLGIPDGGTTNQVLAKASNTDQDAQWVDAGTGSGDLVGPASSVNSQLTLFNGTTGKLAKAHTGSGLVVTTSGVVSNVAAPSGTVVGTTDTQTLTGKTINGGSNTLLNLPASGIIGVIPVANLASGTPNGSKFVADDGTLKTPAGGGDVTAAANFGTDNRLIRSDGTAKGTQSTGISVDDSNNVTGIATLTADSVTAPSIAISATHAADDTYHGITLTGLNAGATIAQWDAVYLGGSSTWLVADANGSGTYPARGLAVASYSSTDPATILVHGTARNDAWSWTPGGDLYVSATAGGVTQTAPSTSGDKVQKIGFALTADVIFVNFGSGEFLTVSA